MIRGRTERRRRARSEAKELRAIGRELAARGVVARAAAVNRIVAPGAPFFWRNLKARIAARETFRPVRSLEVVRDLALEILTADGVDLAGLVLKVDWRPPVLRIEAVPAQEEALAAIQAVRARAG